MTQILSGIDASRKVYSELIPRIKNIKEAGLTPGLAVFLVGENPASHIYVNSKTKKFKSLGLHSKTFIFDNSINEETLLSQINAINNNKNYNGILLQLPLPKHLSKKYVLPFIDPRKDVDGFHPENVGLLSLGNPRFVPCTPKGIMRILSQYNIDLNEKHVVVLGRSNIVGRPISILTSTKIKGANATTTVCHSGTKNIEDYVKSADVLISAIGIPNFIKGYMLKNKSVIIDVGINRVDSDNEKGYKLVGDIDWDSIQGIASFATPVPGGVGPMTIAMLVENTVEAAEKELYI